MTDPALPDSDFPDSEPQDRASRAPVGSRAHVTIGGLVPYAPDEAEAIRAQMHTILGDQMEQLAQAQLSSRPAASSDGGGHRPAHHDQCGHDDQCEHCLRPPTPTWEELTVAWLLTKKPSSRASYLRTLQQWLSRTYYPHVPDRETTEIWLEYLPNQGPGRSRLGVAASTLAARRGLLSSWYNFLIEHGASDHNPAADIRLGKGPVRARRPVAPYSLAASAVLVEHALGRAERLGSESAWRDAALVTALYYTTVAVPVLLAADLAETIGVADTDTPSHDGWAATTRMCRC
ncbi:site-specific integrase [Actinomadura montaniterrae]|uniref:Core-binding (CB) domain-containing protein n=1 Tax=Actinomadura montaniterrae TaxID=1803903 RepID=A0A6L3VY75_9ACTN|nr:hypothetical protein [Actinomadura montaniterrae]KAB2384856.1 hypothetical protein F9B16_09515 [Actinomadura montaniterrae]